MKTLRESILTSIGQGDKYFDDLLNKYKLDPEKIIRNKDGSIDYNGDVNLSYNDFTKIPFKFNAVTGYFDCGDCEHLLSLEGCPKEVGKSFYCQNCRKLTSLEGCPKKVGEYFNCSGCKKLKNLKGCPKQLSRGFSCYNCTSLLSLEGCPKQVGDYFFCRNCGKEFTKEEVRKYCNVKKDIYV